MRRYLIRLDGYTDETFTAGTASKARYAAFSALREAGHRMTFRDFLARVYVLHLGPAHP